MAILRSSLGVFWEALDLELYVIVYMPTLAKVSHSIRLLCGFRFIGITACGKRCFVHVRLAGNPKKYGKVKKAVSGLYDV